METLDKDTMNTVLFYQLLNTFQNAAWQQLGKRVNPLTDKIEKDFDQASLSIGMLDMLLVKTQGNLSDDEKQFLEQAVADLKLNYVEEVDKAAKEKTGEESSTSEENLESETTPEADPAGENGGENSNESAEKK